MTSQTFTFIPTVVATVLGLLVCNIAAANTTEERAAIANQSVEATVTDTITQIPHTLKALEEAKAGKYGKLRAEDRQLLDKADREIRLLMQENDDLAQLDPQQRTRLFNAQETVMGIVSGLKRTQLVCTYHARAGTRFKTKHCMTREMADAVKRGARDSTHAMQNPMCVPGETSPCSIENKKALTGEGFNP